MSLGVIRKLSDTGITVPIKRQGSVLGSDVWRVGTASLASLIFSVHDGGDDSEELALVEVVLHVEPLVNVAVAHVHWVVLAGPLAGGPHDLLATPLADTDGEEAVLTNGSIAGVSKVLVLACHGHISIMRPIWRYVNT